MDTPGFNHTDLPDFEVLKKIADCLNKTYVMINDHVKGRYSQTNSYQQKIQLSGLLYFHDISQIPVGRSSLETFRLFERLCGNNFRRIVLATTMWDQATEEVGAKIEEGLKCIQWRSLIQRGSSVKRFMKTRESAFEILIPIFDTVNETNALLLQREMNELGLQLKDTTAGRSLYAQVDRRVTRLQELVVHFRTKFQQATLNSTSLNNSDIQPLVAEYQQVSEELQKELQEMKIQTPIGERIQRVFKGIDWGRLFRLVLVASHLSS